MSKRLMLTVSLMALAGVLIGCEPKPMVEFTAPRVMMHMDAPHIVKIETTHGDARAQKLDAEGKMWQVIGTGTVRIELPPNMTHTHTVEVTNSKVRVHGVDVESAGAMRNVYVEDDIMPNAVHVDRVK